MRKYKRCEYVPTEEQKRKLIEVNNLYLQHKTLQKTADSMGVTRERIRQLLETGERYGLFRYVTSRQQRLAELIQRISREDIIVGIVNLEKTFEICTKYKISLTEYFGLIKHYQIQTRDLYLEGKHKKYLLMYSRIVDILGHHPSTSELQHSNRRWRYLNVAICKLWGSIDKFRREYGIDKPPHKFSLNTKAAWQERIERNKIKRQKNIEATLRLINELGGAKQRTLSQTLNININTIRNYLEELCSQNKIKRIDKGNFYFYEPELE